MTMTAPPCTVTGEAEAQYRLEHQHGGEDEERRTADQCGEHLGAFQTERQATLRRPLRKTERDQRYPERGDVGEHVRRVGKQRE